MVILHLIASVAGLYGAERVILELASRQQELGLSPRIVSIGLTGEGEKAIEAEAAKLGLVVDRLRIKRGVTKSGMESLLNHVRTSGAAVVHSHGYKTNIMLGILPARRRLWPLVVTVHGWTSTRLRSRMAWYEKVDRLVMRNADAVVAVSREMFDSHALAGIRADRKHIVSNGISPRPAVPSPQQAALAGEIDRFRGHRRAIVTAGRLSPEKNQALLVDAVALLVGRGHDLCAVIFGQGGERQRLEMAVQRHRLVNRVKFAGYHADAAGVLNRFDVFVLPSKQEGLPIVLLEAMQAGTPVVATSVGGIPDALDSGRGGILLEDPHPSALADAIERILNDGPLATRLATYARNTIDERYSGVAMARQYAQVYEAALRCHLRRAGMAQ